MHRSKSRSFTFKITEYPIILSALACFLGAFLFGSEPFSSTSLIFLVPAALLIAAFIFLTVYKKYSFVCTAILSVISAAAFVLVYVFWVFEEQKGVSLFILAVFLSVVYLIYCRFINNKLNTAKFIPILFFLGFMLRLAYILYTSIYQRQHDVQSFESTDNGHGAYILYLLNNRSLPNFNVSEYWQFYHPPLHHIISAIWLWLQMKCGLTFDAACEGLQFLTLFYSTISMYLAYRIMRELNLRRTGLAVALAIIAFHPTFIIFAGSINNDILSVTFILGAILNTIVWYKKRTFLNILKIALCVGLGMFTKLSVWMVAPAIAVVFLIALIKNNGKLKCLIVEYASFLVICVPIGLFWSVRNYLLFKVSPTYVPKLPETSVQYVGNYSLFERLFDFNFSQFKSVYNQMEFYGGEYFEYNPTTGLFKTAMFDESINDLYYPSIAFWGKALFWISVILGILGFIAMIYMLFRKKSINLAFKLLLGILYFVMLISYYIFCFQFPFCCTQSIRYASPLIVLGAIFIGMLISANQNKRSRFSKYFRWTVTVITACFCITSAMTYILIGIK